jgi:hypothetical protein
MKNNLSSKRTGSMAQVIEFLLSKFKTLNSNPITTRKKYRLPMNEPKYLQEYLKYCLLL